MTTKHVVADDQLGRLARKQHELTRRVLEGTLEPERVLQSLQGIIEGRSISAPIPSSKFEIFKSLGVLEVPADYVHATRLADFRRRHQGRRFVDNSFYFYERNITDENFSNPSRIVCAGEKFSVDLVRQIVNPFSTKEEWIAFVIECGGVLLGAQGASLVFDDKEMRANLSVGWYFSLDKKERLYSDRGYTIRIPYINVTDGDVEFNLGYFDKQCFFDECFFLFREVK